MQFKNNVLTIIDKKKVYDIYIKDDEIELVIKLLEKALKRRK